MEDAELIKQNLKHLSSDMSDIKKELKILAEVLKQNALLEQKLISSNEKHDEGRKVIHKRIDAYAKVVVWFGSSLFVGMAGVIWTLFDKIYGN